MSLFHVIKYPVLWSNVFLFDRSVWDAMPIELKEKIYRKAGIWYKDYWNQNQTDEQYRKVVEAFLLELEDDDISHN